MACALQSTAQDGFVAVPLSQDRVVEEDVRCAIRRQRSKAHTVENERRLVFEDEFHRLFSEIIGGLEQGVSRAAAPEW